MKTPSQKRKLSEAIALRKLHYVHKVLPVPFVMRAKIHATYAPTDNKKTYIRHIVLYFSITKTKTM